MAKKDFHPDASIQSQVADHVRVLIHKGVLPISARIPNMRALAKLWGTSYFPVHGALRLLAREGLLVQGTRRGTFVAGKQRTLRRISLYHDQQSLSTTDDFCSLLSTSLYRLLSIHGITAVPYFDNREAEKKRLIPPEIREMIRHREIDALIASSIHAPNLEWINKLGIPRATTELIDSDLKVEIDVEAFVQHVLDLARQTKSRRIGLICPPLTLPKNEISDRLLDRLKWHSFAAGISVECPALPRHETEAHLEEAGDFLCEKLLTSATRPDLIVVYPETYVRGVVSALLRHGVTVPKDMTVISHRYQETFIYIPFPMIWLVEKISDYASGLLRQVERQAVGETAQPILLPVEIERTL